MPNIPGATNVLPGVFSEVVTDSRGVSIPGGLRITAIIGEGSTDETIVSSAVGNGNDGLDDTFTTSSGADGRHFQLANFPLIQNRTKIYKNGILLQGTEGSTLSETYDYMLDYTTGQLELQTAYIQDQGGSDYTELSTNVGDGYLSTLTLVDINAPSETWTIRCISVQRNVSNNPIDDTAKFLAFGSISGAKLDSNGNPIIWKADGYVVSNGIISFAIYETKSLGVSVSPFRDGDGFIIKVKSGALNRNDSLTANYIPQLNLNDPLYLEGMDDVTKRHGFPSTDNNLSLGSQLLFANQSPGVLSVQSAPPMPRRTSYLLSDGVPTPSTNDDDFIFPLPNGVTPDPNSEIHFFTTHPTTKVETQILPNKLTYYTLDTAGYPTTSQFVNDNTLAPAGYSYFYTVKQSYKAVSSGFDGYVARTGTATNAALFSSSVQFTADYVGKSLKIIDATNVANNGTFVVDSVANGDLYFDTVTFADFTTGAGVSFQVIDPTTGLAVAGGSGTDGALTSIISTPTATLTSAAVDFSLISSITTKKLKITGSAVNNGTYDITAYNVGLDQLTIEKAFVIESALRYEVLDTTLQSNYVVINKNVIPSTPTGFALRVTLIDNRDAAFYDAGWLNALESLEQVECDIIVPLPKQTPSIIFQNTLAHCKTMSNIRNRKERVMFTGMIQGLTVDNLTGAEDAAVEDIGILEGIQGDSVTEVLAGNIEDLADYSVASAFGNTYRCVYIYPDQITVQAGSSNVVVDGFYAACALAGFFSATPRIDMPATNKVLSGFTISRSKQLSTTKMESLADAGVTVLQPVAGGARVIWGITTTQSGFPEEEEISIVFIRDRVAKQFRAGFADFIGLPESDVTVGLLNSRAVGILNSFLTQKLITDYAEVKIARDATDSRQFNISCKVQPTYPINWIYIKVAIGTL